MQGLCLPGAFSSRESRRCLLRGAGGCLSCSENRPWALGLSSCGRGLSRHGSRALKHRLSLVGRELSFSTARGVLPDKGSNPCLLRRQVDSSPVHHQGSPREPEPDDQGRPWGPVLTHLPAIEGTWTRSLVWEDTTCRRAAKPMHTATNPNSDPRSHCDTPTHRDQRKLTRSDGDAPQP